MASAMSVLSKLHAWEALEMVADKHQILLLLSNVNFNLENRS